MISQIIPKNKIMPMLYSVLASLIVVAQLFGLDKAMELEALSGFEYFGIMVQVASFVTILSLIYANDLAASDNLLRVSKFCLQIAPVLWLILIIGAAYSYGADYGAFGVYLSQIKFSACILLAIFAHNARPKTKKY